MDPIVEALAVFLGFWGWVLVGVALPNRFWRISTVDGNVITTSTIYENLWMSCATDSTGVHNCREFPSLLSLSGMTPRDVYFFGYIVAEQCLLNSKIQLNNDTVFLAILKLPLNIF